ncbi:MAG: GGDEF domain-containing protein [Treponema sp.]|nr:GGDEF domain-containing protein [Treponema sp.]
MENSSLTTVYLTNSLEIKSSSTEFFIAFEENGKNHTKLQELVLPEEQDALTEFLIGTKDSKKYSIFHLRDCSDNYNLYIITSYYSVEKQLLCVEILKLDDAFQKFKDMEFQLKSYTTALCITGEYVFIYRKSDNSFSLHYFLNKKRITLFAGDIDTFQENSIRNAYFLGKQIAKFKGMIQKIKNLDETINESFESTIRSSGNLKESIVFKGVRQETGNDEIIVGRILNSENEKHIEKTKSLIEELKLDSLTKVFNKKAITEYAIERVKSNKTDYIALMIIDLDHFKPVNDAYGHIAGDKVLAETGRILKDIAGESGVVGRYGGDEFIMVIGGMTSETILRGTLHAILAQISNAFEDSFDDIHVTASVGCALHPTNGKTYKELFNKADFCLYRAKDKGRNRYVFFRDELHAQLYKKATEAKTDGIKYDDREVKELEYMSKFMQDLGNEPLNAIAFILKHMKETYGLDDISLFYGKDMELVYTLGNDSQIHENAHYAFSEGFKAALNGKKYVRVDFPQDFRSEYNEFSQEMKKRGVLSTIQCILGTENDIKGLVTFNRTKAAALFAEYEQNCAVMFASILNLLPESTKTNFLLYSRLKS